MNNNKIIKDAYLESINNKRCGDKIEELLYIQNKILNAKKIVVATNNKKKFDIINNILISLFKNYDKPLPTIEKLDLPTNSVDLTRFPAINKGLIAVDTSDTDIVIARGRLGAPGSGSMLIIIDNKGRCLSASLSPTSLIHKKDIEDAVKDELNEALERIGINIDSSI
ncbi:DUF3236 domain-containing protein [Methanococcus aeolicus]|uniref:DUF3236 domain-containing protein n=1 Tax=Methanococcus aeolicus TaxID=42879 RepID=UPI0021C8AC2A|nr:DUF3236 domain-containing protein [Methanococcus aeolicus]UXM84868.1 DUF3236 domain-containing protein [Methanococcus aeolicus]